jgi:hydroxyacylglutathione hydrolase
MAEIKRIAVGGYGDFGCYLVAARDGFILVDSGTPPTRAALEKGLAEAGCGPGRLMLAIMTNGLMDSTGNAAWVREAFGAPVAVHRLDAGIMADPSGLRREWRSESYAFANRLVKGLAARMIAQQERIAPDLEIDEDFDLPSFGWDARIVHLPGYTKGSIGILDAGGAMLTGNAAIKRLGNYVSPYVLGSYAELNASLDRLLSLGAAALYPLQGPPFPPEELRAALESRKLGWLRAKRR